MSAELIPVATSQIESRSQRNWPGDPELITELEHLSDGTSFRLSLMWSCADTELGGAADPIA